MRANSRDHAGHEPGDSFAQLSHADRRQLAKLAPKLQLVRDRVAGVAKGYKAGCILTGRGGIGKSWAVINELERLGTPFQLHNAHLTPRGLFDELASVPSAVHVIEDAEEVLRHPLSLGILRSATWGSRRNREGRLERLITWRTHQASRDVEFDGGVVLISNRILGNLPEMRALATRIPSIELSTTDGEMAALMRSVALQGHRIGTLCLDPEECLEVAEFIIAECSRRHRPLDMRLLVNALSDRLQAEDHDAGCQWQDLVASSLLERPSIIESIEPVGIRAQKKVRELEIAREIVHLDPEARLRAWKDKCGASQSTLYRRLGELGQRDSPDLES